MERDVPLNVPGERYASSPMVAIWGRRRKAELMRRLWIADLVIKEDLGVSVPAGAIEAYRRVKDTIDLNSISRREAKTRHDVLAHVQEFNALAGYECIHQGFTSRDETDNLEQLQIRESSILVRDRTVATLRRFGDLARQYAELDACARTHYVPAQVTTLGKRFSTFGEVTLKHFAGLESFIATYAMRGIKGPVGTQSDMMRILGSAEKAREYEDRIRAELGFESILISTGQVYDRSFDLRIVNTLKELSAAPSNFAIMVRLMAGHEAAHEGFGKEQSGSSAMPHKMNSRTCERIYGLANVLSGHVTMASAISGNQWLEGDVSCSVVRRMLFPDVFFVCDGLLEATMTVLDEMEIFPILIERELRKYLPYLSTTQLLSEAVTKGMGRETAHSIIKKHATEAIKDSRSSDRGLSFVERLSDDPRCNLSRADIDRIVQTVDHGRAPQQVQEVCAEIDKVVAKYTDAAAYRPEPIL